MSEKNQWIFLITQWSFFRGETYGKWLITIHNTKYFWPFQNVVHKSTTER